MVELLKTKWIPTFGAPRLVLTDRGSQFTATSFSNYVTRTLQAHYVYTSPYHPQGNFINERAHGVIY